jgi:methyl-accepting chemotaxis protein
MQEAEHALEDSALLLQELIHLKEEEAMGIADVFAHDERIISALKSKNQSAMAEVVDPVFEKFQENIGMAVFEIGDEDGIVFYRGHNPGKFGDDKMSKKTIQAALNDQHIAGTETGSSGIAIRAFVPIDGDSGIIGTMQIGFSGEFFEIYKSISEEALDLFDIEGLIYSTDDKKGISIEDADDKADNEGGFRQNIYSIQ